MDQDTIKTNFKAIKCLSRIIQGETENYKTFKRVLESNSVPVFEHFITYHGDIENNKKIYGCLHQLVTSIDYQFSISKDAEVSENLLPLKPLRRLRELVSNI